LTAGTMFTILSILESRKAKLAAWKNNSLAVMTHSTDETLRKRIRVACETQKLEEACKVPVYVREHDGGIELAAYPPLEPGRMGHASA